jgi:hypothetical protein
MNRKSIVTFFAVCLSVFGLNAVAQVENVIGQTITNQAASVAAYDAWFASDDSDHGQTAILLANGVDGANADTHTLVLDFPDYASREAHFDSLADSDAFAELQLSNSPVSSNTGQSLWLRINDNGKSWNEGDYVYIVTMKARDAQAYIAANNELMNSDFGKAAPGGSRLVVNRAGGSGFAVLISAPSFVELNEYLDSARGNEDFAEYRSKVADTVTLGDSQIAQVVKVWK